MSKHRNLDVLDAAEQFAAANSRLVIARGETEETIKHLRASLNCEQITPADYWPLQNRAVTIVKMLNSLLA